MKKKTLLTSIASIAMCASLVGGATYALFTSESTVNVAVTSGKVDVEATIGNLQYKTLNVGWTAATNNATTFDNIGGSATIEDNVITLDKIVPGDAVKFDVTVTNYSNVTVLYRTIFSKIADDGLFDGLEVTVGNETYDGTDTYSEWETLAAAEEDGTVVETFSVVIELPNEEDQNQYQGKTCKLEYVVEAVQGNATVSNPFVLTYGDVRADFVTLEEALAAYEAAQVSESTDFTIEIAEGTYRNVAVYILQQANKNLTVKANGNVTFVNNSSTPVIKVDGGGKFNGTDTLKIEGFTFELSNTAFGIKLPDVDDLGRYNYIHNVTISNCKFIGSDNTGFGIQSDSKVGGALALMSCEAEGIDTLVSVAVTTLSVSDCQATNVNSFANNMNANTTISNCNANVNGPDAGYVVRTNGGELTISGSTLTLVSQQAFSTGAIVVRGNATVALTNNKITANVADDVKGLACTICSDYTLTITSDKAYSLSNGYKATDKDVLVKKYGENGNLTNQWWYVLTANGLVEAFKEGGNVSLVADVTLTEGLVVPVGVEVALDLNGKTVSQAKAQTDAYAMITNKGTLTIADSVGTGKISFADITEYSADIGYASNTIRNEGVLNVTGGTIENASSANVADYGYPHAIDVYSGSVTNISGGTIKNEHYDSIRIFCNSATKNTVVNISGGNIINRVSFQLPNSGALLGELNITGGTFTSTDAVDANVRLIYFGNDLSGMKATISGGTFDKGVKTNNYTGNSTPAMSEWLTVTGLNTTEVDETFITIG